ncbi:cytochrome P450 [Microcoleus sp. FACHB-1515]|uniref:cytochrome P450 n=1 Tax=Cyanophyceae TaxID=3028117 RepID=UPI00168A142A|nr:cytochrome P450 [Microcoleus sp. FACHB-1515]MBD2088261.1 cytochrome P450 [Microcoleus sp. FACHB-1515]
MLNNRLCPSVMPPLPPGPSMPQLLWQARGLFAPLELLDEAHSTYGDLFRLPYDYPAVCVCSPTGLQAVFTAPADILASHQRGSVFDLVMGEHALVFLEGKAHQRHRQWLMPPFHGEQLQGWGNPIMEQTRRGFAHLPPGATFNVRQVMKHIALTVILQVVMGRSSGDQRDRLRSLLSGLFRGAESPLHAAALVFPFLRLDWGAWSPWGDFLRQKHQINQLLLHEICQRQEFALPRAQTDLLGLLLQVKDETGQGLSPAEI